MHCKKFAKIKVEMGKIKITTLKNEGTNKKDVRKCKCKREALLY